MDISDYKHCVKCDNVYPKVTGFYTDSARYDGLGVYCRKCQAALIDKSKARWKREELVRKLGGKCSNVGCGYDKDIRALQIDHVNGGGNAERRKLVSPTKNYDFISANLDSGQYRVLCANCNTIERHINNQWALGFAPMPEPIVDVAIRETLFMTKRKVGRQKGAVMPNQAEKLKQWREANPDAFLDRNEKIRLSKAGKPFLKKKQDEQG